MRKLLLLLLLPLNSFAQSILLDAEIQTWLEEMFIPLTEVANVERNNIFLGVILDDEINAFATLNPHGGHSIFLYSGLILKAQDADEVRGVLAHELAHVQANHLFELRSNINRARWAALAGAAVGLGAAAAGGGSDAAVAGILSGQAATTSNLLSYSRTQEREADNLAEQYLLQTGHSIDGLYRFMQSLWNENLLLYRTPPPYLMSHPQPSERLQNMELRLEHNTVAAPTPDETFKRIQAKIAAFNNATPGQTLRTHRAETTPHRIARTIAYLQQDRLQDAANQAKTLLEQYPTDPYIHELQAHIALNQQDFPSAIQAFQAALSRQEHPLFRFHLARTYQAQRDYQRAAEQAERVVLAMPQWPSAHQLLGTVLAQNGQRAAGHISLAEAAYLRFELADAKRQLILAEQQENLSQTLTSRIAALRQAIALQEE